MRITSWCNKAKRETHTKNGALVVIIIQLFNGTAHTHNSRLITAQSTQSAAIIYQYANVINTVNFINTDCCGLPRDVCVNRGPCYPKTENKSKMQYIQITHTVHAMPIIIIIFITPQGSKAVIFWSKSNKVCLCLLLILTHTIQLTHQQPVTLASHHQQ